jgi:hypothetical protein
MNGRTLSDQAKRILIDYVKGEYTAAGAAWILWKNKIAPIADPRAADVIKWSKDCGFGIPNPPENEVNEQAKKANAYLNKE